MRALCGWCIFSEKYGKKGLDKPVCAGYNIKVLCESVGMVDKHV